jgi:hypothetical protein
MTFALVLDDTVVSVGRLPGSARLLDGGAWFCPPGGLANATQVERELCGWFAVVDAPPQFDVATEVRSRGDVSLVAGVPTRSYTVRAKTPEELAAEADVAERRVKAASVALAVPWLREQSDIAAGLTVTAGNANALLAGLIDNVGQFYGYFADLLEAQRFDEAPE